MMTILAQLVVSSLTLGEVTVRITPEVIPPEPQSAESVCNALSEYTGYQLIWGENCTEDEHGNVTLHEQEPVRETNEED